MICFLDLFCKGSPEICLMKVTELSTMKKIDRYHDAHKSNSSSFDNFENKVFKSGTSVQAISKCTVSVIVKLKCVCEIYCARTGI